MVDDLIFAFVWREPGYSIQSAFELSLLQWFDKTSS